MELRSTSPNTRAASGVRLAGLLALQVAAVAGGGALARTPAYRIDWRRAGTWIDTRPPVDVAVGLLSHVALVLAVWLLVTTLAHVAARATRSATLIRATGRLTTDRVRRLADRVVTVGLVAATGVGGPAGAVAVAGPAAVVAAPTASPPLPGLRVPSSVGKPPAATTPHRPAPDLPAPAPAEPPAVRPAAPATPVPATTPAEAAPPPGARAHVVVGGEHLWALATRRLAEHHGRPPAALSAAEVAPYWLDVVATNRARLASGDPDLVRPGEVVWLPDPAGR